MRRIGWFTSMLVGAAGSAAAQWITFQNETAARLLAEPAVAVGDVREKDYAWGDLDQDGDIDLVCVRKNPFPNTGASRNVLFMNEGTTQGHPIDGVLVDRTAELAPAMLDLTEDRDVALADLNGDGWLDVITAVATKQAGPKSFTHPRVYLNLGTDASGKWLGLAYDDADRVPTFPMLPQFNAVAAGDVDGDGDVDLYFTDAGPFHDRLLINDGAGYFTDETEQRLPAVFFQTQWGVANAIADMNGDRALDLLRVDHQKGLMIAYNSPIVPGFFFLVHQPPSLGNLEIAVADLNNDGRLDIAAAHEGSDQYGLNAGNDPSGHAIFTVHTFAYAGGGFDDGFAGNVHIADLDNDGFRDVLIADVNFDVAGCGRRLHIYRNLKNVPNVTLQEQVISGTLLGMPFSEIGGTHDVAVFDINGDGRQDLVIGRCVGTSVWVQVPPECPGDIDEDGKTCQADLGILLSAFGKCENEPGFIWAANLSAATTCPASPSQQVIDQSDLGVLLADYGCGGCP